MEVTQASETSKPSQSIFPYIYFYYTDVTSDSDPTPRTQRRPQTIHQHHIHYSCIHILHTKPNYKTKPKPTQPQQPLTKPTTAHTVLSLLLRCT